MFETDLKKMKLFYRGKARDIYELDDNLLIIATDRISCFDYVLPTQIPDKGKVLNKMSFFWFDYLKDILPNHVISKDISAVSGFLPSDKLDDYRDRIMIAKKAKRINIECVVRGYLSGSAWKEYKDSGNVCGIKLPGGMKESEKLPEPIFTPAVKSMSGHDINVTEEQMIINEGGGTSSYMKEKSLLLYKTAVKHAAKKGIIIADTKFEFGTGPDGKIILIDEVLTPDSSRFWDKEKYAAGRSQDSFDKQFVRDYLESIKWGKQPPVPELPSDIVQKTREKYFEAYKRLTS
jgi:phosphoribosylaminoimidazole-succinocarboxamide synthase